MKKKLTAVLLTLCMVLGMLPMSAFAAWYDGETAVEGELTVDSSGNYEYAVLKAGTVTLGYVAKDYTIPANPSDTDTVEYYKTAALTGETVTLTWKADGEEPAVKLTIKYDLNLPEGVETTEVTAPADGEVEAGKGLTEIPEFTSFTATVEGTEVTYNFKGWTLDASAEEIVFIDADTTFAEADATEGVVTLYAVWAQAAVIKAEATVDGGAASAEITMGDNEFDEGATDLDLVVALPDGTNASEVMSMEVSISKDVLNTAHEHENITTVNINAVIGSIALDSDALSAVINAAGESDVVFAVDTEKAASAPEYANETATLQTALATADELPNNVTVDASTAKAFEVSLTANGTPIFGTNNNVEFKVSVSINLGSLTKDKIGVFYLGTTAKYYEPTGYENGVLSWKTTHLSPWSAVEITDGSDETADVLTVTTEGTAYKVDLSSTTLGEGDSYIIYAVTLHDGSVAANWSIITSSTEVYVGKPNGATKAEVWVATTQPTWSPNGTLHVNNVIAKGTSTTQPTE